MRGGPGGSRDSTPPSRSCREEKKDESPSLLQIERLRGEQRVRCLELIQRRQCAPQGRPWAPSPSWSYLSGPLTAR